MRIAIHQREGSFSDRWIPYCQQLGVEYRVVNCYDSNIVDQLSDCEGLLWHWSHTDYKAYNFARQLIFALEKKGIKVFPSYQTCCHFDDKVGQKYLLESINATLVSSYVFYSKNDAKAWISQSNFPKVFKLRGGAGSQNVKIVRSSRLAKKLTNRAFGKGFPLVSKQSNIKQRFWVLKRDRTIKAAVHFLKGFIRFLQPSATSKLLPLQKGYIYFQDFIPDNSFDDRIVVIGNRAVAIRRYNRKNDFRASGSGIIDHNPSLFSAKVIAIAFDIARKLNLQSAAFDFIYGEGDPLIVEISYAFAQGIAYDKCPGYWDNSLNWHAETVNLQHFIIEDFIGEIVVND